MGCNANRKQLLLPPNTIPEPCGRPLGFPSKLDLIAWDPNVYDTIANDGGYTECGDSWIPDASGSRGVLSNDMIGSASEDPLVYAIAKRRYYNQKPFNPFRRKSQSNNLSQATFGIMTGESNYTNSELTNLPRNVRGRLAGIGLASSPFDYPNESNMATAMPQARNIEMRPSSLSPSTSGGGGTKNISTPNIPTTRTATRSSTPTTPLPPDLTGGPMIPESGPGSTETIEGYPTLNGDTTDTSGGGGGGMGGGMGGEELPPEEEILVNGGAGERTYMGLTKKQGIIALILLVVAYYWWKNKKK